MSLLLLQPGFPLDLGERRLALSEALAESTEGNGGGIGSPGDLMTTSGMVGWWDASCLDFVTGPDGAVIARWSGQVAGVADRSGVGGSLTAYSAIPGVKYGVIRSHLSGVFGGIGRVSGGAGLAVPALDPDFGFRTSSSVISSSSSWTWYLVWSRPNWRQGSGVDQLPITLLSQDGVAIAQVDSSGGAGRLVLFPGPNALVLSATMERRHTHSLIIRYTAGAGLDVWLDDAQVGSNVSVTFQISGGAGTLLLHSGLYQGGAQCWLHEAACWLGSLPDVEVQVVRARASRWVRGRRRGVTLLVNGQSNAVNYASNDGAASLLAQGAAWYAGALAHNVIASTGLPLSYTMQSGHGIYPVANGTYPGSFLRDPGDGSDPTTWGFGVDGEALQRALLAIPLEDRDDICAIVWPWNETDSLRSRNELEKFTQAMRRLIQLERGVIGKTASELPLVLWSAIPYGTSEGTDMHRQAVSLLADDPTVNVVVGNRQTAYSNARGSSWNETTGSSSGGDFAHRDGNDNRRFAKLAAAAVGRAIAVAFEDDALSLATEPTLRGVGPAIVHAYLYSPTQVLLTIQHDGGTDLILPRQAVSGRGFVVMDGGVMNRSGVLLEAISCSHVDSTHLLLTLPRALLNSLSSSGVFYPYGSSVIGRGNSVTDNYSLVQETYWWDVDQHLGDDWRQDYPLAATLTPVPISSVPL